MTLGDYRDLCVALAGAQSKAVAFFDKKIAEEGRDAQVIADESQMMFLIARLLDDQT